MTLHRFLCVLTCFSLLESKAVNGDTVSANNKNKILKRYLVCFLEILTGTQYLTFFSYEVVGRMCKRSYRSESLLSYCEQVCMNINIFCVTRFILQ